MCVCRVPYMSQDAANDFAELVSVDDVDKWSMIYGPVCFILGFRLLFYIALVTKHSGSRK